MFRKLYLWIRRKKPNNIKKMIIKELEYEHSLNLNMDDYDFGTQSLSTTIPKNDLKQCLSGTIVVTHWNGDKLEIKFSTKDVDLIFNLCYK